MTQVFSGWALGSVNAAGSPAAVEGSAANAGSGLPIETSTSTAVHSCPRAVAEFEFAPPRLWWAIACVTLGGWAIGCIDSVEGMPGELSRILRLKSGKRKERKTLGARPVSGRSMVEMVERGSGYFGASVPQVAAAGGDRPRAVR